MRDARGRTRDGNAWKRCELGDGCTCGRDVKWGTQASCVMLDSDPAMHVDAGIQRFIRNTCEMHGAVLGKNHD